MVPRRTPIRNLLIVQDFWYKNAGSWAFFRASAWTFGALLWFAPGFVSWLVALFCIRRLRGWHLYSSKDVSDRAHWSAFLSLHMYKTCTKSSLKLATLLEAVGLCNILWMTHHCALVFILNPFGSCGLTFTCNWHAKRAATEVQTEIDDAIGNRWPLQNLMDAP